MTFPKGQTQRYTYSEFEPSGLLEKPLKVDFDLKGSMTQTDTKLMQIREFSTRSRLTQKALRRAWVGQKDLSVTGSPREVYFTDFMKAEVSDPVYDIAFPI